MGYYAASNPFRFATKYTDIETGLVQYNTRYYSPSLGRFINRDTIGEAGGLNLYAYVSNRVPNAYDYLGMDPITWEDRPANPNIVNTWGRPYVSPNAQFYSGPAGDAFSFGKKQREHSAPVNLSGQKVMVVVSEGDGSSSVYYHNGGAGTSIDRGAALNSFRTSDIAGLQFAMRDGVLNVSPRGSISSTGFGEAVPYDEAANGAYSGVGVLEPAPQMPADDGMLPRSAHPTPSMPQGAYVDPQIALFMAVAERSVAYQPAFELAERGAQVVAWGAAGSLTGAPILIRAGTAAYQVGSTVVTAGQIAGNAAYTEAMMAAGTPAGQRLLTGGTAFINAAFGEQGTTVFTWPEIGGAWFSELGKDPINELVDTLEERHRAASDRSTAPRRQ